MAYGHRTEHRLRVRAQVVLHAARGRSNARIAHETGLHLDTVRAWRGRFAHGGQPALADRKRSGQPARFPLQVAEAKALACQLPAETGIPLSRWSCPELAAEPAARGITDTISASTVRRWLHQDALEPWQYRSWIFIRDPASAPRPNVSWTFTPAPSRAPRWARTTTSSPATRRPAIQARAMRVNHEQGRGGALAYLAAYDVHRAKVFGRCEPKTGIVPFMSLVTQVMTTEPYASAKRVCWIVDNGSSHHGQKAIDRLTSTFPNTVLVHTPVHAFWTNQIEIFFSIVQRKVVSPNGFTDPIQVWDRLRSFEDRYNAAAQPFQWKFTASGLNDLLARLCRGRIRAARHPHQRWPVTPGTTSPVRGPGSGRVGPVPRGRVFPG
ncbi:IS630 family transposase [Streptomyces mirabilis]|uniref:IS630 family transposase n=1 Tax=Streptomyces mirabilis TaxID=68239 RepID=UPI00331C5EB7